MKTILELTLHLHFDNVNVNILLYKGKLNIKLKENKE